MKNQKSTVNSRILDPKSVSNFAEIERLKSLNRLLKRADTGIEPNLLQSMDKLKEIIEKKP